MGSYCVLLLLMVFNTHFVTEHINKKIDINNKSYPFLKTQLSLGKTQAKLVKLVDYL